ncbi:MAG TPA: EamA family transporter [Actinomycetota bacterium]
MPLAVLFGLGSSLCWGVSDFFGGVLSRRLSALAVALWSQAGGGVVLAVGVLALGGPPTLRGFLLGAAGGIGGGAGLLLFYRALAEGAMSIVAPLSACGAAVPVAVAVAGGEVPSPLALAGMAVAFAGVVLVSRSTDAEQHPSGRPALVVALSFGAALGFGWYFVMLHAGSVAGGSPLWTIMGGRASSLSVLAGITLLGRKPAPWPGRGIAPLTLVGSVDAFANLLFAVASTKGNLGVVGVLGSLYPVATVLLARFVLAERLSRVQGAGVALALAGVALLATG